MRKSLRWKRGKEDKKERRLRGGGLGGRLKMMLRLVGDGQHKLMRKRLRKPAMSEVNISRYPGTKVPGLFSFSRAVIFKSGVSCRNIGQEQFRVTQSCGAAWI